MSGDWEDRAAHRTVPAASGEAADAAEDAVDALDARAAGDGEALLRRLRGALRTLRAGERQWRAGRATAAEAVRCAHGAVGSSLGLLARRSPQPSHPGVWLSEGLLELSVARPELAVSLAWPHEVDLAWLDEAFSRLRNDAAPDPADADRALAVAAAWLTDAVAQSAASLT